MWRCHLSSSLPWGHCPLQASSLPSSKEEAEEEGREKECAVPCQDSPGRIPPKGLCLGLICRKLCGGRPSPEGGCGVRVTLRGTLIRWAVVTEVSPLPGRVELLRVHVVMFTDTQSLNVFMGAEFWFPLREGNLSLVLFCILTVDITTEYDFTSWIYL
jgi:hypothetical protein